MGISCKQAVDFISKREEGRLSPSQRFELWQHLAICRFCRAFNQQNKLLASVLKKRRNDFIAESSVNKEAIMEALEKAKEM